MRPGKQGLVAEVDLVGRAACQHTELVRVARRDDLSCIDEHRGVEQRRIGRAREDSCRFDELHCHTPLLAGADRESLTHRAAGVALDKGSGEVSTAHSHAAMKTWGSYGSESAHNNCSHGRGAPAAIGTGIYHEPYAGCLRGDADPLGLKEAPWRRPT